MTVVVDIGGTKTLIAAVRGRDVIQKLKFPTPKDYSEFLRLLSENIQIIASERVSLISIGCAGSMDRASGIIKDSPNLGWQDKSVAKDLANVFSGAHVIIENDANLAGLSEAHNLENVHQKVIYVTFSTGVGTGFIEDGVLVPELLDSEGGHMIFEHNGRLMDWESFAAGRAIVEKYGKLASELNDPVAWAEIAQNMAIGIIDNCAVFPADTVIIGGGVGTHFAKYGQQLNQDVVNLALKSKMVRAPIIVGAKNAEEAVMLGCIILASQYEQR